MSNARDNTSEGFANASNIPTGLTPFVASHSLSEQEEPTSRSSSEDPEPSTTSGNRSVDQQPTQSQFNSYSQVLGASHQDHRAVSSWGNEALRPSVQARYIALQPAPPYQTPSQLPSQLPNPSHSGYHARQPVQPISDNAGRSSSELQSVYTHYSPRDNPYFTQSTNDPGGNHTGHYGHPLSNDPFIAPRPPTFQNNATSVPNGSHFGNNTLFEPWNNAGALQGSFGSGLTQTNTFQPIQHANPGGFGQQSIFSDFPQPNSFQQPAQSQPDPRSSTVDVTAQYGQQTAPINTPVQPAPATDTPYFPSATNMELMRAREHPDWERLQRRHPDIDVALFHWRLAREQMMRDFPASQPSTAAPTQAKRKRKPVPDRKER